MDYKYGGQPKESSNVKPIVQLSHTRIANDSIEQEPRFGSHKCVTSDYSDDRIISGHVNRPSVRCNVSYVR